jgi:hypothetical protein
VVDDRLQHAGVTVFGETVTGGLDRARLVPTDHAERGRLALGLTKARVDVCRVGRVRAYVSTSLYVE